MAGQIELADYIHIMRIWLYSALVFLSFPAFSLSPWETSKAFLEYQKKKELFFARRERALKARLKDLARARQKEKILPSNKGLLEHERQKRRFENIRVKAFARHKKHSADYQKKRARILKARLKELRRPPARF